MALIECPECKHMVSDLAEACPHCGYPLKKDVSEHSPKEEGTSGIPKSKDRAKAALLLCGVVALIIASLSISNSNRRASTSYNTTNYRSTNTYSTLQKDDFDWEYISQRNEDLHWEVTDLYSNSSYTVCEGTLKNSGTKSYEFIKIKGSFEDANGNVVDTDWTYAVGSEGLSGGETTTFRLSVKKNTDIKSCKLSFVSD
jgi:DNA repair exonuclease SbcCD ATPase subunit